METELRRGYSGTAKRKGRQQTNWTYCHRATFLLYRDEVRLRGSSMEGQLDRQLYGSEFELAKTRPRPIPAHRRAPKLSEDRPGSFTFRIYEAIHSRDPASSSDCFP